VTATPSTAATSVPPSLPAAATSTPVPTPAAAATPSVAPSAAEASAPPSPPSAAPPSATELPGYDTPQGHFFPANLGSDPNAGYWVYDGGQARFWSEYQRLGGYAALGSPMSRRYQWQDWTVQHFANGVLRWLPDQGQADIVPLEQVGNPPPEAVVVEPPPLVQGEAVQKPWSGWWWPATTKVRPPHLFDAQGPLAKYDHYVQARTGWDPGTLAWERSELFLRAGGPSWAGHCNGWAAAALIEPEPTAPVQVGDETFSVDDQKGLLSDFHFADAALWLYGGGDDGLSPVDFHHQLITWLARDGRGMVLVFNPGGEEIWSYPAYRVQIVSTPDQTDPDVTHVKATVWMADNNVPANFVGLKNYPSDQGQTFEYALRGDRASPDSGVWEGASARGGFSRPWEIWYPEPSVRNVGRLLASPNLDYTMIREILAGGPSDTTTAGGPGAATSGSAPQD